MVNEEKSHTDRSVFFIPPKKKEIPKVLDSKSLEGSLVGIFAPARNWLKEAWEQPFIERWVENNPQVCTSRIHTGKYGYNDYLISSTT